MGDSLGAMDRRSEHMTVEIGEDSARVPATDVQSDDLPDVGVDVQQSSGAAGRAILGDLVVYQLPCDQPRNKRADMSGAQTRLLRKLAARDGLSAMNVM